MAKVSSKAQASKKQTKPGSLPRLEDRFEFALSTSTDRLARPSRLWKATGKDDGEDYMLRLFPKSGTGIDADLRALLEAMIRRIRRVLAKRATRDVLVEVIEIIEDEDEIGVLMRGAGNSLDQLDVRAEKELRARARTTTGRLDIWREIGRLSEALSYLHSADLVHGMIDETSVFIERLHPLDLRLGGYEACIHVASVGSSNSGNLAGSRGVVSFRKDWQALGVLASHMFCASDPEGPELIPSERRLLSRLQSPPRFERLDGTVLAEEIDGLIMELGRIGSSGRHELVLYPSRDVLKQLPNIAGTSVSVDDPSELVRYIGEDLANVDILATQASHWERHDVVIATDSAVYEIKIDREDERIGIIFGCRRRSASDNLFEAKEVHSRIHICTNRLVARDRVRTSGHGAMSWVPVGASTSPVATSRDVAQWHALILIEVFALLKSRFRHYPVEVVDVPDEGLVRIAPRIDKARDTKRSLLRLKRSADALDREMRQGDELAEWTLTASDAITLGANAPKLSPVEVAEENGRRLYVFSYEGPLPSSQEIFLRPWPDRGTESAIQRRLSHIVDARGNLDLLLAMDDPNSVGVDETLRHVASPGDPPDEMDTSKVTAWDSIRTGKSLSLVVGPPGVGKTFLISRLVQSILRRTPNARILISAQNHDALAEMQRKLEEVLPRDNRIVVRVERARDGPEGTVLRQNAKSLLRVLQDNDSNPLLSQRRRVIDAALSDSSGDSGPEADAILRDTDHLLLRSADVTLATANSSTIEEMIAEGEQFDWVVVEEAARAGGPELVGPLLLGNRRVLIGDHHQLAPFEVEQKIKLYDEGPATVLLEDAVEAITRVSDLPDEVQDSLRAIKDDPQLFSDVLATAARMEEPFRAIAEASEERQRSRVTHTQPVAMLTEQSRMHPAICRLVSNTFYEGKLLSSDRVKHRHDVISVGRTEFQSPIIVLDLPSLSLSRREFFERRDPRSYRNEIEAKAVMSALGQLGPTQAKEGLPQTTLAVLSPYGGQVFHLKRLLARSIKENGTLFGFSSPKGDGEFVHTVDGFQGGEADIVMVSLVRNNSNVGPRALGFLRNRQRMNVLLSRARHKLVVATSLRFLNNALSGVDPEGLGGNQLDFLKLLLDELYDLQAVDLPDGRKAAGIVSFDEQGRIVQ